MLQLYEAQDELMVVGDSGRYVGGYEEGGMNIDNLSIKQKIIDKLSVNNGNADKICRIILYLRQNPYSSTASIAEMLGISVSSAKIYLRKLIGAGFIVPHGANKPYLLFGMTAVLYNVMAHWCFFKPRVGNDYQEWVMGLRTLVLGAYHYCCYDKCRYFKECIMEGRVADTTPSALSMSR